MKLKLCTALLTAVTIISPFSAFSATAPSDAGAKRAAMAKFGALPLSFEPTANPARYVAHSGSYSVSVGAVDSSVAVTDSKSGKPAILSFSFEGANRAASLQPSEPLRGVTDYLIGADPSKWRMGVKNYAKLLARGIYPGVDVSYYGDHRRLEFDFVVAPKANPKVIALTFAGADKLTKDASGDIVAEINGHPVRIGNPNAYQRIGGTSKVVAAAYELSNNRAELRLGEYDHNAELIIDPVVSYATYLGGSGTDAINAIAIDSNDDAYVTGSTTSTNFPSGSLEGVTNAFLIKYAADGSGGYYKAYTKMIGGNTPAGAFAVGYAVTLDLPKDPALSDVYVVGTTSIRDLPGSTSLAAPNSYAGGDSDAFIMVFNASSGSLVRMSYLGGSKADSGYGVAVDQATPANVIVVGQTCSWDFPQYNAFETKTEGCVAFVTKLDNNLDIASPYNANGYISPLVSALGPAPTGSNGETFYFSETYGGQPVAPPTTAGGWIECTAYPQYAIVSDTSNPPNVQISLNAGISGLYQQATSTTSIATPAWNSSLHGTTPDGYQYPCAKGNPAITWENLGVVTSFPDWATEAYSVAVDPPGDVFLVGGSNSPALSNSWTWPGECSVSGAGAWILKVSGTDGSCTYLHTLESTATSNGTLDTARAVAVDGSGRAYITGTMSAALGSVNGGYEQSSTGGSEAFVVRYNNAGSAQEYAASIGGSGNDQGLGIAVDSSGAAYVTGLTQSANFPVINGLQDPNSTPVADATLLLNGGEDAFVAKLSSDGTTLLFSSYLGGSGNDQGNAIATDTANAGDMYVAGSTSSSDLIANLVPETGGVYSPSPAQPALGGSGNSNGFFAKIAGNSLPTVTVLPGGLQFSYEDVGATSVPAAISYTNNSSTSTVSINSITFTGDFQQEFKNGTPTDCTAVEIAPSSGCNLWVAFSPTAQGKRTGTVTIADSVTSTAHVINLSGVGASPVLALSPGSLTFSNVYLGTTSGVQQLDVQNNGKGTLTFTNDIGVTGDFAVPPASNTCGSSVAPGGACTIGVTFTPTTTGTEYGQLTLTYNASSSPTKVSLTGTVALVPSAVNPSSYDFGSQAVGSTSAAKTFTVQNTDSTQTLHVSSAVSSNPTIFVVSSNGCTSAVTAGNSCTVQVKFSPIAAGAQSATITITGNGSVMPYVISLIGTGTASTGVLQVTSPTNQTLTFGTQNINTTATQTVTVYNSSTTTAISGLTASVGSSTTFKVASTTCSSTLAALASCQYTISFTPTAVDSSAESATLTVSGTGVASVLVSMSGTGVAGGGTGSGGNFTVAPVSSQVSVVEGTTAYFTLNVAPVSGSTDTVKFTCSSPSGSTCSVSPTSLTMDGTSTKGVTLTVNTGGGSGTTAQHRRVPEQIFFALLPISFFGVLISARRRGFRLAFLLITLALVMGMAACGGGGSSSSSSGLSPNNSPFTITFNATSSAGEQTTKLTLVVTAQ